MSFCEKKISLLLLLLLLHSQKISFIEGKEEMKIKSKETVAFYTRQMTPLQCRAKL